MGYVHLMTKELSAAVDDGGIWQLRGTAAENFGLVNEFMGYLAARLRTRGERSGLLAHTAKPKSRSQLRVREPRRLPRGLSREESAALLGSFRSLRDRAIGGLMLLSGLRSAEVLSLRVTDVD